MCVELDGVCIPRGGGQEQIGGEPGGLVKVDIAHVKRPPTRIKSARLSRSRR